MRIAVTSESKLKIGSVIKAYASINKEIEVIGYASESGVGEQPVNEQTLEGARNRIADLKTRVDGFDKIISIENGIFREGEKWLDKAVVVIYDVVNNKEYIEYSESIVYPDKYVEKASEAGFDTMTVSQVMFEDGYVTNTKDPHLTISGISRQVYLEKVLQKLIEKVELV